MHVTLINMFSTHSTPIAHIVFLLGESLSASPFQHAFLFPNGGYSKFFSFHFFLMSVTSKNCFLNVATMKLIQTTSEKKVI